MCLSETLLTEVRTVLPRPRVLPPCASAGPRHNYSVAPRVDVPRSGQPGSEPLHFYSPLRPDSDSSVNAESRAPFQFLANCYVTYEREDGRNLPWELLQIVG